MKTFVATKALQSQFENTMRNEKQWIFVLILNIYKQINHSELNKSKKIVENEWMSGHNKI